jgi:hypothetical protein
VSASDDVGAEPSGPQQPAPTALRVLHGNPSPEELAALLTVVAARSGDDPPTPPARSLWGRPLLRGPHHPAAGAWRESALPR